MTDASEEVNARKTAAGARLVQMLTEGIRSPVVQQVTVGKYVFVVRAKPIVTSLTRALWLLICVIGVLLMETHIHAESRAGQVGYESGGVLVAIGFLVAIARPYERILSNEGMSTANARRGHWRWSLFVVAVLCLVLAVSDTVSDDPSEMLVTFGVATIAALAIDILIVRGAERLFEFEFGATSEIIVDHNQLSLRVVDADDGDPTTEQGATTKVIRNHGPRLLALNLGYVLFSVEQVPSSVASAPTVAGTSAPSSVGTTTTGSPTGGPSPSASTETTKTRDGVEPA